MLSPSHMLRRVGVGLAVILSVAACGGSTITESTASSTAVVIDAGPEVTESTSTTLQQALTPEERVAAAVDTLAESGQYSFEADVTLTVEGTKIDTELEGWVDGDDRQITLKADGSEVTTTVIDGVATVERDGEVTVVALTQASDAPSLEILTFMRNMTFSSGAVTGKLSASDLSELGYEVNGSAAATVFITADGTLSGYELSGTNDAWAISVMFSDL